MRPEYTCFYSYKGGVGRSLALANLAYLYASEGEKVLIIDLDLEAPGQHHTSLFKMDLGKSNLKYLGILDLLNEYASAEDNAKASQHVSTFTIRLEEYAIRSSVFDRQDSDANTENKSNVGFIDLLPATINAGKDYQEQLANWNWDKFYDDYSGAAFWLQLKSTIKGLGYTKVLIDSRTGLSDVFYISALSLADNFVCVTGLNNQNIEGTNRAIATVKSKQAVTRYGNKKVVKVLSNIPNDRPGDVEERKREISKEYKNLSNWQAKLYYSSDLALYEDLLILSRGTEHSRYVQGIKDIHDALQEPEAEYSTAENIRFDNPFKQIRAEYCSEQEVARSFVDPGGNIKAAMEQFMPTIVFGSRGTGKTTLARWYSYETQAYYKQSQSIYLTPETIERIGLWFRIDMDILDSFNTANLSMRPDFNRMFSQFWDLIIIRKALEALDKFGGLAAWAEDEKGIKQLFQHLSREIGHKNKAESLPELMKLLEDGLFAIRSFINNPHKAERPFIIQSNVLLKLLVAKFLNGERFKSHYFVVSIDEYENFHTYQQKIINTRIKQARDNDKITYKIFVRNNGMHTHETLASEQRLEETHDFRSYRLDSSLTFDQFKEHLSLVLSSLLRQSQYFRNNGATDAEKQLLGEINVEDEANDLVQKRPSKLYDKIESHLQVQRDDIEHDLAKWCYHSSSYLRVAVIHVLLSQGKNPDILFQEFSEDSKKARDWYHNYKMGALFWLLGLYKSKKVYAGFNSIVGIAGNNLRTAIDLCYVILEKWWETEEKQLPISPKIQSIAVTERSERYFRKMRVELEDKSYVPRFVERLGRLFEALHKAPRQSEPEINHFVIRKGELSDKSVSVLKKAEQDNFVRWLKGNKQKEDKNSYQDAYQISPRFVPFFKISWRRKKALYLTSDELDIAIFGDDDKWNGVFNKVIKKGKSKDSEIVTHTQTSFL